MKTGTDYVGRIYKPKYMDDTNADKDKQRTDTAVSNKDTKKEEKPGGRARSRSIWGRNKKDAKPATPDLATLPTA